MKVGHKCKISVNISKIMPASAKKHGEMGYEYHYSTNIMMQDYPLGLKYAFYSNALHVVQSAFTSPSLKKFGYFCVTGPRINVRK